MDTCPSPKLLDLVVHCTTHKWVEPRTYAADKSQFISLVEANQKCVDSKVAWRISTDHKLLR